MCSCHRPLLLLLLLLLVVVLYGSRKRRSEKFFPHPRRAIKTQKIFYEILSCPQKDGKSKRELHRTLSRQRQKIIFLRVSHYTNLHPHPQPSIHPSIRTKSLQIRSSGCKILNNAFLQIGMCFIMHN